MKCFFTGLSDAGVIRPVNQDSYHIDPIGRFFIVADGMGGHAGGQEASRIATQTIQEYLTENWDSTESSTSLLEQSLIKANQAILADQRGHPERSDMGTTAVVVLFRSESSESGDPAPEQAWCGHIGDSRLYRLRDNQLEQVTEDHTWVARAMKLGHLSVEQGRMHPWRHVLSQCLGREDLQQMDVQPLEVLPGDRLLLCSDGLTEELSDQLIEFHLKTIRASDKAVSALINAAKEKGGRDNITVVLVTIDLQP
jgi:serine/threonine protein phosphatase PrpC